MHSIISKEFLPSKSNVFVWLNAGFLIILLLIDETEPLTVVMAYFLETIIIGIVQVFKLYKIILFNRSESYKTILNFLSHYLFFIGVQLVFVFAFIKFYDNNILEAYYLVDNLIYVMNLKGMVYVLASIVVYNVADYLINFHLPKAYKTTKINSLILQPYNRILVQQLAVVIACFFFFFVPGVMVVAISLILLKTWLELRYRAKLTTVLIKN